MVRKQFQCILHLTTLHAQGKPLRLISPYDGAPPCLHTFSDLAGDNGPAARADPSPFSGLDVHVH
jgi:hypothetical protein